MPDPQIAQQAAAYVATQTTALIAAVAALGTLGLCFAWAGRKVREVI